MSNPWLNRTDLETAFPDRDCKDRPLFFEHPYKYMDQTLVAQIEATILAWLQDDTKRDEKTIEIRLTYTTGPVLSSLLNSVHFDRHEVNIRNCSNSWDSWQIASSAFWPRIISHPVKTIVMNDHREGDIIPHELK